MTASAKRIGLALAIGLLFGWGLSSAYGRLWPPRSTLRAEVNDYCELLGEFFYPLRNDTGTLTTELGVAVENGLELCLETRRVDAQRKKQLYDRFSDDMLRWKLKGGSPDLFEELGQVTRAVAALPARD